MRILALDIETKPAIAHVWGAWDQNIGLNQIVEEPGILCFAAQFVGERKMHFHSVPADGEEGMLQAAWDLLDEADVVLTYNGKRFDMPWLEGQFAKFDLGRPAPYQHVDLFLVARRQWRLFSNKLEFVARHLGLDGKVSHEGHGLWTKCMGGDELAWRRMRRYNIQDVRLLIEVYERMLPWIPSHPNLRLTGGAGCPKCGNDHLERRGTAYTSTGAYQRYRCVGDTGCGSYFRSTRRSHGVNVTQVAA